MSGSRAVNGNNESNRGVLLTGKENCDGREAYRKNAAFQNHTKVRLTGSLCSVGCGARIRNGCREMQKGEMN